MWSPHFHVLGYGWVKNTAQIYARTGWVIKNLGVRKTVGGTALYQLSHAGVKKSTHTITWFGQLSYNRLKIPKMPKPEKPACPLCGNELRRILMIDGSYDESKESFWITAEKVTWRQHWRGYG